MSLDYVKVKTKWKVKSNFVAFSDLKGKVHTFWEGHKILQNLHLTFVLCSNGQTQGEYFAKFCGLLRIYELYYQKKVTLSVTVSDTSDTFLVATSVNFQPTSATLLVNFEAPKENADQLWKKKKKKRWTIFSNFSCMFLNPNNFFQIWIVIVLFH